MRRAAPCVLVLAAACSGIYYGTMEKLGYHKRDLLVERVQEGREEQAEAQKQFQSTFDAFKHLTGLKGNELEATYKKLSAEHDRCKASASAVSDRVASIEKVARDMFAEWKEENEQYQSADLKRKSAQLMGETQRRYDQLIAAMKRAEATMQPVLSAFGDQVLFLKHNLNAQAIASLQDTVVEIEVEVGKLIAEMQRSIEEADAFIASMDEKA
jgi:hypothetical protein